MKAARRWSVWVATAAGITLGLWVVALAFSITPPLTRLPTSVHGLSLADYSVSTARRLAPLSRRIIQDVRQDQPSPSPTPGPRPSPTPGPSPSPTSPIPTLPTVPPLPTGSPLPSLSPPPLP